MTIFNNGQLNRNVAGALNLDSLDVSNSGDVELIAGDSVTSSTSISNSNLTVSGATLQGGLNVSNGGTVTLDSGSVEDLSLQNGVFNFNGGTLEGSLSISEFGTGETVFNRCSNSILDLTNLEVFGDTMVDLLSGDMVSSSIILDSDATINATGVFEVDSLEISRDSTFNFSQVDGQQDGLLLDLLFLGVDDGSVLNLTFDSAIGPVDSLDFALRVDGNQSVFLQSLIDGGQLTFSGNRQDVELFFDATNNFTSLGFITVAVPEPSSLALLGSFAGIGLLRRRRFV